MDYGDNQYGRQQNTTTHTLVLAKLQRLQKMALKICLNVENRHPTSDQHKETKSATLYTRRESYLSVMDFTYSREKKYIHNATRSTRTNDNPVADLLWLAMTEASNLWQHTSGMNNRAQPETSNILKQTTTNIYKTAYPGNQCII